MREFLARMFQGLQEAMATLAEAVNAFADWVGRTVDALASAGALHAAPPTSWSGTARPPRQLLPSGGWRTGPLGRPAYRPRC